VIATCVLFSPAVVSTGATCVPDPAAEQRPVAFISLATCIWASAAARMANGIPQGGAARMGALVQTLEAFEPTTKSQEIALEQTFANLDAPRL
jgi:hypothetical protein